MLVGLREALYTNLGRCVCTEQCLYGINHTITLLCKTLYIALSAAHLHCGRFSSCIAAACTRPQRKAALA